MHSLPCHHMYVLEDALCKAPVALLAILPPQDQAVLSSCSKQMLHLTQSCVTAITVQKIGDVRTVLKSTWPQLALIKVQPTTHFLSSTGSQQPQNSNFLLIASLDSMPSSIVSSHTETDRRKSIAAAFCHLRSLQWRLAVRLTGVIHSCDKEVRHKWPGLTGHVCQPSIC